MLSKHGIASAYNGTANRRTARALVGIQPQQHLMSASDLFFAWMSVLKSKHVRAHAHVCISAHIQRPSIIK